ncbi:hypothetical protein ACEUC3_18710 [Aeromonas bivalvium]|uniref:hypothetical protein n=1 Tax=Aeromonas bivalvium TaxID=440079 RepID=UPI0038CFE673
MLRCCQIGGCPRFPCYAAVKLVGVPDFLAVKLVGVPDFLISDVFHLKRPKNQFAKKEPKGIDLTKKNKKSNRRGRSVTGEEFFGGSEYYSVRSLVSKFIRYRKDNSLSEHKINIQGKDVSYKSQFKGVYKQSIATLPDENLIYWGVAFIDYIEKKGMLQSYFR